MAIEYLSHNQPQNQPPVRCFWEGFEEEMLFHQLSLTATLLRCSGKLANKLLDPNWFAGSRAQLFVFLFLAWPVAATAAMPCRALSRWTKSTSAQGPPAG